MKKLNEFLQLDEGRQAKARAQRRDERAQAQKAGRVRTGDVGPQVDMDQHVKNVAAQRDNKKRAVGGVNTGTGPVRDRNAPTIGSEPTPKKEIKVGSKGSRLGGDRKTVKTSAAPSNTIKKPQPTYNSHVNSTQKTADAPAEDSSRAHRQRQRDKLDRKLKKQRLSDMKARRAQRDQDFADRQERKAQREKDEKRKKTMDRLKAVGGVAGKLYQTGKDAIKTSDEDRTKVAGPSGDVSGGSSYQSRTQRN